MQQNIAVLIDFENIATGTEREGMGRFDIRLVMNRFKEKGRILVARSYADWGRYAKYKQDLLMQGVRLFELTSHGMQDKNRADVAMVVDCMELAFTKDYVDTFVVVSGDSDFTPLVLKLKELDKRVIGCGTRKSTSRLIVEACDEFVFYDTLKKSSRLRREDPAPGRDERKELTRAQAFDLMIDTLEGLLRESTEAVPASVLKQAMLRKEPSFSDNDLGYSSFGRFLEGCRDRGMIRLSRDDKAGSYRVEAPRADEEVTPAEEPEALHALRGEPLRIYQLLESAGIPPLPHGLRSQIVTALIEVASERERKGLKSTVRYAHQDVFKRVIGAHPGLASGHVKAVVKALHQAGTFLHPTDLQPVRSVTAGFTLGEGVRTEGLMEVLTGVYVSNLRELGVNLSEASADVAEVIFGDRERARKIEEVAAWSALREDDSARPEREPRPQPRASAPAPAREEDAEAAAAGEDEINGVGPARTDAEEDGARGRRTRKPRNKVEDSREQAPAVADADTTDGAAETAPAEEVAPAAEAAEETAPAKKTTRKRTTRKKSAKKEAAPAEPAAAAQAAAEPAAAEAAPAAETAPAKKTTRKRTTRKKPAKKDEAASAAPAAEEAEPPKKTAGRGASGKESEADPAEAAATAEEAPAKKTTRRRAPRKKAEAPTD